MHSNALQSLDIDYLESLASNVGTDISAISSSEKIVQDPNSLCVNGGQVNLDVAKGFDNSSRCVSSSMSVLRC
jgi:hypothetical protein